MSTVKREWLDNAFWNNAERKDSIEAILQIVEESGRIISQQLSVRKTAFDGSINPDFEELIQQLGEDTIDANTTNRKIKKENENNLKKESEESKVKARELEKLFDAKIRVLEVEEIKKSKNRSLKSKLRRSKNVLEMQMYAQLIMMEELGYITKTEDPKIEEINAE